MKKFLLILCMVIVQSQLSAQKYFEKTFPDSIITFIQSLSEVNDSVIQLNGERKKYPDLRNVVLNLKNNSISNFYPQLLVDSIMYSKTKKLIQGDYISAGIQIINGIGSTPAISKLTAQGQVIWQKKYPIPKYAGFNEIAIYQDSIFYFLGSVINDTIINKNYSDLVLMRTNAEGDAKWIKKIDLSDYDEELAHLNICGNTLLLSNSNLFSNPVLCKLDLEGNIIWKKNLDQIRLKSIWENISIINNAFISGQFIFGMGSISNFNNGQYLAFLKFDSTGKLLMYKDFRDSSNLSRNDLSMKGIQLKDKNFLIAGIYDKPLGFGHQSGAFYMIKVDSSGNKIWECHFDNNSYHQVNDVAELKDGSLMMVGTEKSDGNAYYRGYLVKTSANGTLLSVSHFNLGPEQLEVFPNPAREQIRVYNPQKESLKIFDMQGVLAKEIEAGVSENVNIRELKPGEYIIKSATGRIARFVKE